MTKNHHHHDTPHKHDDKQAVTDMAGLYDRTVDAASQALTTTRESVANLARRTTHEVEGSPLGILIGGLALGALVGALLPRSEREREMLAPIGARLSEAAQQAIAAAKEAGQNELQASGLTRDAAMGQVHGLVDNVVKALSSAGTAAVQAATGKPA